MLCMVGCPSYTTPHTVYHGSLAYSVLLARERRTLSWAYKAYQPIHTVRSRTLCWLAYVIVFSGCVHVRLFTQSRHVGLCRSLVFTCCDLQRVRSRLLSLSLILTDEHTTLDSIFLSGSENSTSRSFVS